MVESALDRWQPCEMEQATLYDYPTLYDLIVRSGPCEAFYRELARRSEGPILDMACGTGRLTIPLAADGHRVIGVDASAAMLSAANAKVSAEKLKVEFVRGDIRTVNLNQRFALVVVGCNSLAHLITNDDLEAGLANIRRHLAPGGVFAFDIVNPRLEVLAPSETEAVRLDLGPNPSAAIAVEEVASYDSVRQVRTARWSTGAVESKRQLAPLQLRLIFPQELRTLLKTVGLELRARYGDFAKNPLTADSLNQICVARVAPNKGRSPPAIGSAS